VKGVKKISLEIKLFSQLLRTKFDSIKNTQKFELSEAAEVPSYDATRFGEITVFEPQKDF